MTNPRTTQCGIYNFSLGIVSIQLNLSKEKVRELLDKLINYGKVIYNEENSELMIVNWYKYNVTSSRNTHICINKELKKVKTKSFIARFYECCKKENISLDTIFEGIEIELAQESEAGSTSTEETVTASSEKDLSMKKIKVAFDNNLHIATFMEIQEL